MRKVFSGVERELSGANGRACPAEASQGRRFNDALGGRCRVSVA
jgi:hypothetical protein